MSKLKFWTIEEIELDGGGIAHRQTEMKVIKEENGWKWDCPVDRLDSAGQAEWYRVLNLLKDVNGEDLRHIVCGAGLMDHCFHPTECEAYLD